MALLEHIRESARPTCIEEGTDGWYSAPGWARLWDASPATTDRRLRQGLAAGLMETQRMRIAVAGGSGRPVNVYRAKQI